MKFKVFMERYGGAKNHLIMYHGTSVKNISGIMEKGLLATSPNITWDDEKGLRNAGWYQSSLKALPGIYLTGNLVTALMSARSANNFQNGPIQRGIVVVQIQPRTLKSDEDDINKATIDIPLPNLVSSEYLVGGLYFDFILGQNQNYVNQMRNHYVEEVMKRFTYKLKELHPELINRLKKLLWDGWPIALTRKVAYIDDYSWKKFGWDAISYYRIPEEKAMLPKPDKLKAEKDYNNYMFKMSQSFKELAWPHKNKENKFNHTARVENNIGFKGKNKIITIMIINDEKNSIDLLYGEIPQDFKDQWQAREGDYNKLTITRGNEIIQQGMDK